ncbi:MAG: YfhO family protein, partial [Burkholderiaceae bacterium]|nr:YfhO family protein [Burkholderiaceae bacterium]
PKLVYHGRDMDIYELPHPAPYFEADDARCKVTPASRLVLDIQCPATTTLTRKEMNYPGWQARIDGHDAPITTQDGLLQSVQVPAGAHRVEFSYTPSHRWLWLGGFLLGLVILLFNLWHEFRQARLQQAATLD